MLFDDKTTADAYAAAAVAQLDFDRGILGVAADRQFTKTWAIPAQAGQEWFVPNFSAPNAGNLPPLPAADDEDDAEWAAMSWNVDYRGTAFDESAYDIAYTADFNKIFDDHCCGGSLFTPCHPDAKNIGFVSAAKNPEIYAVSDGQLTLKLHKTSSTGWICGNVSTVNRRGMGFSAIGGYWEWRVAFNPAIGWPACWLYSNSRYTSDRLTNIEIDFECYGDNLTSQSQAHYTIHRHPAKFPLPGGVTENVAHGEITTLNVSNWGQAVNLFTSGFHRYGFEVTDDWIIAYIDRIELARHPAISPCKRPLYAMLSMQMQKGMAAQASDTFLIADYFRWYRPRGIR